MVWSLDLVSTRLEVRGLGGLLIEYVSKVTVQARAKARAGGTRSNRGIHPKYDKIRQSRANHIQSGLATNLVITKWPNNT